MIASCNRHQNDDKLDLKSMTKSFLHNNPNSIDGYLLDMLENERVYDELVYSIKDSQVLYYYQANLLISKYNLNQINSLEPSISSINLAIKKDPLNSYNYFIKSYLSFKAGELAEADLLFIKGITMGYFNNYQKEASLALINVAEKFAPLTEVKSLYLIEYIRRLGTNIDLFSYICNNLKKYLTNSSISNVDKIKTYNYLCTFALNKENSFDLLNYENSILIYKITKDLPDEIKQSSCNISYDEKIWNTGIDMKMLYDKYKKTKDIDVIRSSDYWKNIISLKAKIKRE